MRVPSLKTLCLNSIVIHFDRFYQQCTSRCHSNSETCLGLYSYELGKRYSILRKKKVKCEYLDVLLNQHTKYLDVPMYLDFGLQALQMRINNCGVIFTHVNLSGVDCVSEPSFIKNIAKATPNVESLNLSHTNCDEAHLQHIAKHCRRLKALNVQFCTITIAGLAYFCCQPGGILRPNKNLIHLDLRNTYTGKQIVYFCMEYFPSLQVLHHRNIGDVLCEMSRSKNGGKYEFSQLPLAKLCLTDLGDTPSLEVLSLLPKLSPFVECLEISLCCQQDLDQSITLKRLKNLYLSVSEQLYESNSKLRCLYYVDNFLRGNGSYLVKLTLECVTISLNVLLEGCPQLEELVIYDSSFKNCSLMNLSSFPHLNTLTLLIDCHNPINREAICFILLHSCNLERLRFCALSGFQIKSNLPFLDHQASIEDIVLQHAPNIVELMLCDTDCTVTFIETFLDHANQLESFIFKNLERYITPEEYMYIKKVFKEKQKQFLNIKAGYDLE